MKRLKNTLEKRICDFLSSIALLCDGKGYFKVSDTYRFFYLNGIYISIRKDKQAIYPNYEICLEGQLYIEIEYDIFRRDVVFQKAYTVKHKTIINPNLNKVAVLLELLEKLKIGRK